MTPQEPTLVSIPAYRTPHPSDLPVAHMFYAVLGMLSVARGRLEGVKWLRQPMPEPG